MTTNHLPRIRQAVLVARDRESAVRALRDQLPLGDPFNDPEVEQFGLHNAVMPLGDTFVEVIAPVEEGTAAGRHLDRLGRDGAYMVMFQVADIVAARARIKELGVRAVYDLEREGDHDIHLHPGDVPGAIVALDSMKVPGSWRWAGPKWIAATPPELGPGRVTGATISAREPAALIDTWAAVLGVDAEGDRIALDGGELRFVQGESDGIDAFHIAGVTADVSVGDFRFLYV